MPGSKQPCPIVAACWSPATPRIRIGPPNSSGFGGAEIAGAIVDRRQHRCRHTEQRAQLRVPAPVADVEQQRPRCIGRIGGVTLAAGQAPQQEAVDRAERQLALDGRRARAVDVIEQPGDFGGGEIRIEQQPGARGYQRLVALLSQGGAGVGGAPVLPDDGIVDRPAGCAIPHHGGFALVGDADRGDVARFRIRLRHGGTDRRDRRGPDFFRIVLDLSRTRIDLAEFLLRGRDRLERGVEHDRARRGRALIDCEEIVRQGAPARLARSTISDRWRSRHSRPRRCRGQDGSTG